MQFPDLHRYPYFAYDTETTGLIYKRDQVFGFSLATPDGGSWYYDIRTHPAAIDWLNEEARYYRGDIIAHNASFDYRMSDHTGIRLPLGQMDDTVIRACCIDEHLVSYSLDFLAKKYLGKEKESDIYRQMADLFGGLPTRNVQMRRIAEAPPEVVSPYARSDAALTLELWEWQRDEIERQKIQAIIKFERDLMPTFIRTEMRGIRVDLNYAEEAVDKLEPIIARQQDELNLLVGYELNANSSPQIKAMFQPRQLEDGSWVTNDGEAIGTTPKGGPSLKAENLRSMSDPRAELILGIRSTIKTKDTFLKGHVISHSVDGRVYPSINQSKGEDGGTGTGRLSYQNPAMQQIPSRNKKVAALVKPCFLPDEGTVWVDCDQNSFEVRIFAHLVNNPEILEEYRKNPHLDLHQFVGDISGLPRNAEYSGQANAKQLNLSMIFNSGNGATAEKMGMEWAWETFTTKEGERVTYKKPGIDALQVINKYHNRIPGVKNLSERAKHLALNRGYVYTFTGRRLRFPNGFKAYKASGLLIQATSADINKRNWRKIEQAIDGEGHIILNTHDSYSLCLPENWEPAYNRVKKSLEHNPEIRVPLILDLSGAGNNWWNALKKG